MSQTINTDSGAVGVETVRCRILPDGRMTRLNAAFYLGLKPKTLAMWVLTGNGPKVTKVGGRVFYFKDDLDAFIRQKHEVAPAHGAGARQ